jgi:glyoxylase I family protein
MRGLHHLDLNVSDIGRSASFYDRILTHMGFTRVVDPSGEEAGCDWIAPRGTNIGDFSLGIVPAKSRAKPHDRFAPGLHHLALKSETREAVDALYRTLLQMNAEILDAPAEYPKYGPGYYAVFFLDPDGLKLEYVFTTDSA